MNSFKRKVVLGLGVVTLVSTSNIAYEDLVDIHHNNSVIQEESDEI